MRHRREGGGRASFFCGGGKEEAGFPTFLGMTDSCNATVILSTSVPNRPGTSCAAERLWHNRRPMILYFAYGSNMCGELLRERLAREGHELFGRRRATLRDHRLVFNKQSSLQAHVGYGNIEPAPGEVVEGTINEMSEAALALLDRIELVPHHYTRRTVTVHDWERGADVAAEGYFGNPAMIVAALRPTRDYVDRLMKARDLLPGDYISGLARVECCE